MPNRTPAPPPPSSSPREPGLTRHEPRPQRILITAGPTHEPIDAVRYIGNRSSGRMGIEIAEAALERAEEDPQTRLQNREVRLLLGPTPAVSSDSRIEVARFQTTADLERLLHEHVPWCDVLIMAAAVADYRPKVQALDQKLKRSAAGLTLELEGTPDLLAGVSRVRRPDQLLVGFALEPADRLESSARDKLARKGLDLIVANELETMDAADVRAWVLSKDGSSWQTPGPGRVSKGAFAKMLMERIDAAWRDLHSGAGAR